MVIVLLCMNGAVNIVIYYKDNEHENKFLWSGALAVKTIRNRLAKLFRRHEQPQSPGIIHKCLIFICLCFNLCLRLPGRLWSCIITSFIFFSFQFNIMILFISSLLPRFILHGVVHHAVSMHSSAHASETKRNVTEWWRLSSLAVEASDFNSIRSRHKRANLLTPDESSFVHVGKVFVLLNKSQREEEEEEKKLHDETIVKKLLFIIKCFDFHENFITLHFSILKNALADFMIDSSFERVHFYDHCMYQSEYNRRRARFLGVGSRLSHVLSFSHVQGFVLWEILIDDIFRGFRSNLKNP